MDLISFSLYGQREIYRDGLVRNIKKINVKMPRYRPIVYISGEQDEQFKKSLLDLGAIVKNQQDWWPKNGMFWRFLAIFEDDVDRVLVRDSDSEILEREIAAISDWERSGKEFHIMRDHPMHSAPILGGMWGAKTNFAKQFMFKEDFNNYIDTKGQDQEYLATIYPKVIRSALVHDSFFNYERHRKPFPMQRIKYEYVGEPVDKDGNPLSLESRFFLKKVEESSVHLARIRIWFIYSMLKLKYKNTRSSL